MKSIRQWIAARLWRRLTFSHLVVILLTMFVLQLAVATLVALTARRTAPVEGDAGWLARSFAHTVGWLADEGREAEIPLILEMVRQRAVEPFAGEELEQDTGAVRFYLSTQDDWLDRLVAVTVLDESGTVAAVIGAGRARQEYQTTWDELVALALSGEVNPYTLSRWLTPGDGGLLLGAAAITRSGGEIAGVVVVEMHPSIRLETAPPLVGSLFGFAAMILVTSLLGLPVLALAALVAIFSGIVVSRSLGQRLKRLEDTAQEMAGADLSLRVPDASSDEIGQLGQAFNRMAEQLAHSLEALEMEKERVETLLRARRDLVANISHDLRTPLASLSAHLETLSTHPDRLGEYLPILDDETTRISHLIADLFELSRLDARELELDLAPVALDSVIDKVIASHKELAWEQRRIVLETHLPVRLPPVQADVQRVEQILVNLIANGLRFTPEGGIVTVEAESLAEEVEVRVSDTGVGISPEDLPHIFERFYRGDPSRACPVSEDRLSSGSGLGLAIVKGLVEAMGGSVSGTSSPGEGTCIRFRLPLPDDATNVARRAAPSPRRNARNTPAAPRASSRSG